jgi:RecB family endonuclease NucS
MPIEVAIWRIDDGRVEPVPASSLDREERLEDVLEADVSILGLDSLLVIGRQVITKYGKRIDLMALDAEGSVYAIELKKNRTPREVVAQVLDYGFWIRQLDERRWRSCTRSTIPGSCSARRSRSSSVRRCRRR